MVYSHLGIVVPYKNNTILYLIRINKDIFAQEFSEFIEEEEEKIG